MCDVISAPLVPGSTVLSVLLLAVKVKGLFVWAPESRPFLALQYLWTLLPECPCTCLWPCLLYTALLPKSSLPSHAPALHPLQALPTRPCPIPRPSALSPCCVKLQPTLGVTGALPELGGVRIELSLKSSPFRPESFSCLRPTEKLES